jgi:hypothetical protein
MIVKHKTWMHAALTLLVLLPFVALPALAQQDGDAKYEVTTKVEKQNDGEQVREERVVIVPRVRVEGAEGLEGADVRFQPNVRVIVSQEEGEDGETVTRSFAWQGEDGEMVELAPGQGGMFFAPGAERGFLGVELTDLTPELRLHFGAPEDAGVLVGRVEPDSPAAAAGIQVGDVITRADGEEVGSALGLTARIGMRKEGDLVALEVVRDRKVETLSATLETRERAQIEVGHLLRRIGEEGEGLDYEFNPQAFEHQMEGVRDYFASPAWNTRVMHMEGMEEGMRERLDRLEKELDKIQQQLDVEVTVEVQGEDDGGGDDAP